MLHILAPVPAVHLPSALETFNRENRVAFGTKATDLFQNLRGKDVVVWIAASSTGAPVGGIEGIEIGKIVASGKLDKTVDADEMGRHPNINLRPKTALDDEPWHLFWEVTMLEKLSKTIAINGIISTKGKKLTKIPLGPTQIKSPN